MITRIISALVVLAVVVGLYVAFKEKGLLAFGLAIVAVAIFEYAQLRFPREPGRSRTPFWSYLILAWPLLFASVFLESPGLLLAQFSVYFVTVVLLSVPKPSELMRITQDMGAGLLGFLYLGLFPAFALKLLNLEHGALWFTGLLLIVFAGDTFAYFTGRFVGREKLFEAVSPKKTIEGAIGGLVGSALFGAIIAQFLPESVSTVTFVGVAVLTGSFAQVGDLFETLLKRVADVKDSGSIMPGHGGVLDRLDGVLFAAPIYYAAISTSYFT